MKPPTAVRLVLDDYRLELRLSIAGVTIGRLSLTLTNGAPS